MLDFAPPLSPETMFRGKYLPDFLRNYQWRFALLIDEFGREKFDRVYDWLFRFLSSSVSFGQWIVVEKVCPDKAQRPLLYFAFELIYQSDLLSQFHFEFVSSTETRIIMDPPPDRLRSSPAIGATRYILVDWYSRLRTDPHCNPDIDPSWLGL